MNLYDMLYRQGSISGLQGPMSLGVAPVMPLMGQTVAAGAPLNMQAAQAAPQAPAVRMPQMSTGTPEVDVNKMMADIAARRAALAGQMTQEEDAAFQSAKVSPEISAILERQRARIAAEREAIGRGESVWDKLARFSTNLAGTDSPFFGTSLARAASATMTAEQKRREALELKRAALLDREDRVDTAQVQALEDARKQALERVRARRAAMTAAGQEITQDMTLTERALEIADKPNEMKRAIDKANREEEKFRSDMKTDALQRRQIEASIANTYDSIRDRREGGGRGGKEPAAINDYRDQMSNALKEYTKAMAEWNAIRQDPDALPGDKSKAREEVIAAKSRYDAFASALRARGVAPDIVIPNKGMFATRPTGVTSAAPAQSRVKVIAASRVD